MWPSLNYFRPPCFLARAINPIVQDARVDRASNIHRPSTPNKRVVTTSLQLRSPKQIEVQKAAPAAPAPGLNIGIAHYEVTNDYTKQLMKALSAANQNRPPQRPSL
jgi:hypothetical protein